MWLVQLDTVLKTLLNSLSMIKMTVMMKITSTDLCSTSITTLLIVKVIAMHADGLSYSRSVVGM